MLIFDAVALGWSGGVCESEMFFVTLQAKRIGALQANSSMSANTQIMQMPK